MPRRSSRARTPVLLALAVLLAAAASALVVSWRLPATAADVSIAATSTASRTVTVDVRLTAVPDDALVLSVLRAGRAVLLRSADEPRDGVVAYTRTVEDVEVEGPYALELVVRVDGEDRCRVTVDDRGTAGPRDLAC